MRIKQYIPEYCSGIDKATHQFSNSTELLKAKWIQRYKIEPKFYRFSLARSGRELWNQYQSALMVEFDKGYRWFVIGLIHEKNISCLDDLPEWVSKGEDEKIRIVE